MTKAELRVRILHDIKRAAESMKKMAEALDQLHKDVEEFTKEGV